MRTNTGRGLMIAVAMIVWLGMAGHGSAAAQTTGRTIVMEGNGRGAQACETCHGITGAGQPAMGAPRLSILSASYMTAQLEAFRQGTRENPLMTPTAKALNQEESRAVAEYYAGVSGDTSGDPGPGTVPDSITGDRALGERLVRQGDWSRTIPPCMSCHGPGAAGVDPGFPGLAGQDAGYLLGQLRSWREGQRSGDPLALMGTIAKRLTEEDSRGVAVYLASLVPAGGGASDNGDGATGGPR